MRYDASDEDPWLMAVLIRTASGGSRPSGAESIESILLPANSATNTSGRNQTR